MSAKNKDLETQIVSLNEQLINIKLSSSKEIALSSQKNEFNCKKIEELKNIIVQLEDELSTKTLRMKNEHDKIQEDTKKKFVS